MPRNMSFALTTEQVRRKQKTVTRRQGWWNLQPGDQFWAVEKAMGLKKGEKVRRIHLCQVVSARAEPLSAIEADDCRREGFPEWTVAEFQHFYASHNRIRLDDLVHRIEFTYCDE